MDFETQKYLETATATLYYKPVSERIKEIVMNPDITILDIGYIDEVEGGLCFDYKQNGKSFTSRLVIGYTELGEWIEFDSDLI